MGRIVDTDGEERHIGLSCDVYNPLHPPIVFTDIENKHTVASGDIRFDVRAGPVSSNFVQRVARRNDAVVRFAASRTPAAVLDRLFDGPIECSSSNAAIARRQNASQSES